MAQEIERKFLVTDASFKNASFEAMKIVQGYLSSVPERSVRIRIRDDRAFITVKGIGDLSGMSRFEWEKEISVEDAKHLLAICEKGIIDKTRYKVAMGDYIFEVDEFHGDNDGLIVAEIELKSEDDVFQKPTWLGKEVTGDPKYYNAMLKMHPYKDWSI
ncbi:CYTH domain-containing protein [Flavobacteriaceae bacterium F08102]|nr:CYTH domain-containing protein [Flavobacteriaceae bacterium F08102]